MKTSRFYKLIIVVLILINLTTLFFLWKGPRRPKHPERNELVEMLDLSGNTKTKILELQDEHFKKKDFLIKRSIDLHESLFQSFNDKSKDILEIKVLIDEIVEKVAELVGRPVGILSIATVCFLESFEILSVILVSVGIYKFTPFTFAFAIISRAVFNWEQKKWQMQL